MKNCVKKIFDKIFTEYRYPFMISFYIDYDQILKYQLFLCFSPCNAYNKKLSLISFDFKRIMTLHFSLASSYFPFK